MDYQNLSSKILTSIKEARKRKGFNQIDIAEKLNISTRTYQRIESGTGSIDLMMAIKLNKLLSLDLKNYFEIDDNRPQ